MKLAELFEGKFTDADYRPNDIVDGKSHLPQVKDINHLVDILQTNCSEMIDAYKNSGRVLYRGIADAKSQDSNSMKAIASAIRHNRQPVQTSELSHDILHRLFIKAGLKATRKNSLFCTTDLETADVWGKPMIVFVKNGWTGTVFESIKNDYAFYKMSNISAMYRAHGSARALNSLQDLKPLSFNDSANLSKILKDKYKDVLITGNSFIALAATGPEKDEYTKPVLEKLGIKWKE